MKKDRIIAGGNGFRVWRRLGAAELSELAAERLPSLAERLRENAGYALAQISILADAVRDAISRGDLGHAGRIFDLLGAVAEFPGTDPEIHDAIRISFLAADEFDGEHGRQAWEALPDSLRALIIGSG